MTAGRHSTQGGRSFTAQMNKTKAQSNGTQVASTIHGDSNHEQRHICRQLEAIRGQHPRIMGKLTGDELDVAAGRRDHFIGELQHHFGLAKEEAEIEPKAFEEKLQASQTN